MGLTPLAVAAGASILLIAVIGVDVSMNRNYALEVNDGESWILLANFPYSYKDTIARPYPASASLELNASDPIPFRLRIDNTYWWSHQAEYVVYVGGSVVTRGAVDVPANTESTYEFSINASRLMGRSSFSDPSPKDNFGFVSGSLEVRVDAATLYGTVAIKEVPK